MPTDVQLPNFTAADLPDHVTQADIAANRFTESALEKHKREGLELAVRARLIALAVIAAMLPFLNPSWEVLYYEVLLGLLGLNGWAQRRFGRVGRSQIELFLLFIDLALMIAALIVPNPFTTNDWPAAMNFRFGNFIYFFVILAGGTLMYSWRTIMAVGTWTTALWIIGVSGIWWLATDYPDLTAATQAAFAPDADLIKLLDPNSLNLDIRVQEIVVFMITAFTLSIGVRRFNRLLLGNAALERERANLSRYFSPNVVDELSRNDEPLKQIREQEVAVMFVDIVGFTRYAADRDPAAVIETLRAFHGRMETEVFRCGGTLDKYLGDGLMATFGTPVAGQHDATDALSCARAMLEAVEDWTHERAAEGSPPLAVSVGVHFGPVVLGDIGANRLEFAVIGNTVNVASRIEALSRPLESRLVMSDAAYARSVVERGRDDPLLNGLQRVEGQAIRGLDDAVTVWTLD